MNVDIDKLVLISSLVGAVSLASEKLVEVIKGFFPSLSQSKVLGNVAVTEADQEKEQQRRVILHILTLVCGVITSYLASQVISKDVIDIGSFGKVIGLGLLASGGASFWNSITTYLLAIKDLKKLAVKEAQKDLN
jgi:hypothetical protein